MFSLSWLPAITLLSSTTLVHALKYDASETEYNLNVNTTATNPLDYWVKERTGHDYHKSPDNWRFPFYTVFMDRFVNGDPTNDNANETLFETDMMSNQIRNGGDLQGLVDTLDYIAGMGIKVRTPSPQSTCLALWDGFPADQKERASTSPGRLLSINPGAPTHIL